MAESIGDVDLIASSLFASARLRMGSAEVCKRVNRKRYLPIYANRVLIYIAKSKEPKG